MGLFPSSHHTTGSGFFSFYDSSESVHLERFPLLEDRAMEETVFSPHPSSIIFASLVTPSFPLTCFLFFYYVLGAVSQISL